MKEYKQLDLKERGQLYVLKQEGKDVDQIAQGLGRNRSSIYRELRRNRDHLLGYLPDTANNMAAQRKARHGMKLSRYAETKGFVVEKLRIGWSPEAIAGRMKSLGVPFRVSSETIYRFVYSNEGRAKELYRCLLKGRPRRGLVCGRKQNRGRLLDRTPLVERPEIANTRVEFGHLEGDLTFFKGSRSENLAVIVERKSRTVTLFKNPSKKTLFVVKNFFNNLAQMPRDARKSITFDNGTEFAKHTLLKKGLGMATYFCDPHSPWQKGQVERTNAQLHRFIPKSSDLKDLSKGDLCKIQDLLNSIPRKCLGFKTPAEVFNENLLVCRTSN